MRGDFSYSIFCFLGFDKNGVRILKIVNPRMDFEPIDPRLVKYLQMRKNEEWIFTNFLQRFLLE